MVRVRNIIESLFHPFQIRRCFSFSRYITFATHLDVHYVCRYIYNKNNVYRKAKSLIIYDEGSIYINIFMI
jgi:hypothetical protein